HDFVTGADNPYDLAVDGQHIYWTNFGDGSIGGGSIGRADLTANPGELATNVNQSFISGATRPRGIDVDANYIYWSNSNGQDGNAEAGDIARANLSDGQGVNLHFGGTISAYGDVVVNAENI